MRLDQKQLEELMSKYSNCVMFAADRLIVEIKTDQPNTQLIDSLLNLSADLLRLEEIISNYLARFAQ